MTFTNGVNEEVVSVAGDSLGNRSNHGNLGSLGIPHQSLARTETHADLRVKFSLLLSDVDQNLHMSKNFSANL
jgi:hypothetical protein